MEERIIDSIKSLEDQRKSSEKIKLGVLHGSVKTHKALENGTPTFRPFLSAKGTPSYKQAKFCYQQLRP